MIAHETLHTGMEVNFICIFTNFPLLLTEFHRLHRISFITLHSQNRQTCTDQDHFAFWIHNELYFVSKILIVGFELHLAALLVLQEKEAVSMQVDNLDLVDICHSSR